MSHPIKDLMDSSIQNLHQLVDVNTIIGDPVTTPDGTTIIPVSKVTMPPAGRSSPLLKPRTPLAEGPGLGSPSSLSPFW